MKKRILFIINPVAGVRRKDRIPRYINKYLDHNRFDYEVIYTEGRGHATEIARDAVHQGYDIVAVAGGDGSVNEAATGLIGSNTALAIIPSGSGNGLARHLGYSIHIRSTLEIINDYHISNIDVCRVNNNYFFSLIGIGFDAFVAKVFSREETRGFFTYAWSAIKSIAAFDPFSYELCFNGKVLQGKAFMLSVCNSNQFGYNIRIAPGASLQDGMMDVIIVRKMPKWKLPMIVLSLLMRTHLHSRHVQSLRTKELSIHSKGYAYLQIDGETEHKEKDFKISLIPGALRVLSNARVMRPGRQAKKHRQYVEQEQA